MPVEVFQLTEEQFTQLLQEDLGENFDQSLILFRQYSEGVIGAELSFALMTALAIACEKGKVKEVLAALQEHWDHDLSFQPKALRGTVGAILGAGLSHTEIAFYRINKGILGLPIELRA